MKPHVNIFIAYGAAMLTLTGILATRSLTQYRAMRPMAESLCRQIDTTRIRVVSLSGSGTARALTHDPYFIGERDSVDKKLVEINYLVRSASIHGDTLRIRGIKAKPWPVYIKLPGIRMPYAIGKDPE